MRTNNTIDLQIFAAGESINGTEGYVNANDGTKEAYGTTNPGLSAEMKTFYDKTLIELASPNLVFDQFAQKRPIPAGSGKTIEFRRFNTLPKALTPITEGVTPTGSKLTVTPVSATVDQYGDYVELTDMLELTSVDPVVVEATRQLADQAGRTIDTVVRNQIVGGTNVNYCPAVDAEGNETEVTSRYMITSDCKLRVKDVFKAAAQLKAMNAPTIDGSYVAVIHPYVAFDLMQDAKGQWVDIQKYAKPENILNGEIGTLGGVRFIQSSEAKIHYGRDFTKNVRSIAVSAYARNAVNSTADYGQASVFKLTLNGVVTADFVGRKFNYVTSDGEFKFNAEIIGVSTTDRAVFISYGPDVTFAEGDTIIPGEGDMNGKAVFTTMFIGANAYGTTDIAGGGIEHIVKQKGYGNDPLNQRSSVGWKAAKVATRLVEEYMLRVESSSSFVDSIVEEN